MTVGTVNATERHSPTLGDRIVNAARQGVHLRHDAHLMKSIAADLIEDGIHEAKRTMKSLRRGVEALEDIKDEGIHYIKRQPVRAVGTAVALGLMVGVVTGWIAGRLNAKRAGHR